VDEVAEYQERRVADDDQAAVDRPTDRVHSARV
jgi:hypothetical protein